MTKRLQADYTAVGGDPNDPQETECAVTVRVQDKEYEGISFEVELFEDGRAWHYDDSESFIKLFTDTLYLIKVEARKRVWVPIIQEAFDGLMDEIVMTATYNTETEKP